MELFHNLALGFGIALTPANLLFALIGALGRHADRRPSRHRSDRHHRDAAAAHLQARADVRPDHARRHLLRRAVWRLDHRHPGQSAGRDIVGRDLHRRPPDGAAGPRRRGARDRGARLVLRRLRLDRADRDVRAAAGQGRAVVRRAGIFLADGARPHRRGGAGARLGDQGGRHDHPRPADRAGRHRRQHRRHALHLRHHRTDRRARCRDARDRHLRHRRDHRQPGAAAGDALAGLAEDHAAVADARRFRPRLAGGAARHRRSARSSACCRAAARR